MANTIERDNLEKDFAFEICYVELDEFEDPDLGDQLNRNPVDDLCLVNETRNEGKGKCEIIDSSECCLLKHPCTLHRSSSFQRLQKALRTGFTRAYEHVILLRAFVAMIFLNLTTIVSARPIVPSSSTASRASNTDVSKGIGKGLGFVWRSFGDLRKVIGKTSSLTSLKSLHNSLGKGSENLFYTLQDVCSAKSTWVEAWSKNHMAESLAAVDNGGADADSPAPIELEVMVKPSYVKQRIEKSRIKKTPSSYQSIYDFHVGLDEDGADWDEEDEAADDQRNMKKEKQRDYMLELVDKHLENTAEMIESISNEDSINTLWDSFKDLATSSHNAHAQDVLNYDKSETRLYPETLAAKKLFQVSSPLSISLSSSIKLKQSPEAIKGLLTVLERAHWWCNNPFAKYSNDNAAQVHLLSTSPKCIVVGFRGSSTIRDIVADLSIGSSEGPLGINVHQGFLHAMNSVNEGDALLKEIEGIISKHGVKRIIFAGYSLGGAVASLFLLKYGRAFEEKGIELRCVTFGCPRFIKQSDVEKLPVQLTSKIMHTFSEGDPIPMSLTSYLPWATRYAHVGNTVVLRADGTSMTVEKDEGKERHHTIKWANPLAFHNHLQENYQKLINFAQIQLKINHLIYNPITKSISNLLKQEKLNKEWKEYIGMDLKIRNQDQDDDEAENFFKKVLDNNDRFPVLKYAY